MIESAVLAQNEYFTAKPEAIRKELGQYFTGSVVADYMASLIMPVNAPVVRILDAGAGTGVLTLAAALRCLELGHKCVHAVLYEIDEEILSHLDLNMRRLSRTFQAQGAKFTFDIRHDDFILARPDKAEELFHVSSINPPYFKYNSKTSPYACATTDLYKGNPNIYASFMAVVASCTAENGQMIAIVPRSFTNGLYFKGFRRYLNATMSLERIHIFRARNKVFKALSVLQENVICSYTKRRQSSNIVISTSSGYEDIVQSEQQEYKTKLLIDCSNEHEIIRIPETAEDLQILETVEQWPSDFKNSGYTISTGRVVEHRTREYITQPNKKAVAVPLLRMHNVKAFKTEWTGKCKKDASFLLLEGHQKHTLENKPYVLLKRFSSKDEKRRLVAGVHNPKIIVGRLVALENHLNYIGRVDSPIDIIECYGLAVLFNSTLMDKYFRCISGNTQVNATEIRLLKLPARKVICAMGKAVMDCSDTNQANIDQIVNDCLNVSELEEA